MRHLLIRHFRGFVSISPDSSNVIHSIPVSLLYNRNYQKSPSRFGRNGLLFLLLSITTTVGLAQDETDLTDERIEQLLVIGAKTTVAGSGSVIDEEELDLFDYSDINQAIASIPGVYVREEDGYGLRPNIGIRGAAAERSLKITIMEDGVLIAPAPYSAPAAYYVPNISRVSGIEVLKGPSAIETGPHTVGGAINLITRDIPDSLLREVDLSYGTDASYKAALAWGSPLQSSTTGFLLEGLSYGSDGFKNLEGSDNTGFVRNDIGLKLRWAPDTEREHRVTVKIAYADEDANETYLGLTNNDFEKTPTRRYVASQMARFQSDHYNVHLNYGFVLGDVYVNTKTYWNQFLRSWNKLDGFLKGRALQTILSTPHLFAREYAVLTGDADSLPIDTQTLEITNNDRAFTSQGFQVTVTRALNWGAFDHDFSLGARFHHDRVRREHQPRSYLMKSRQLVWDEQARPFKSFNRAHSDALALFVSDEITSGNMTMTLGFRYEDIKGDFENRLLDRYSIGNQSFLSPGIGVHWQVAQPLGVFAGIYQGYSPAGPGKSDVTPEQSLNFESGIRLQTQNSHTEAVAFLSDYENLLGRCRVSDAECTPGQEFNGGVVKVHGMELSSLFQTNVSNGFKLNSELVYTYTASSFETGFLSGFSQWGLVREGDELPYLPRHRGMLRFLLASESIDFSVALKHQSLTREEPGSSPIKEGLHADAYTTLDLSASWHMRENTMIQLILGNALDEIAIVSHRPFGARPNRPRWLETRVRMRF